MGLNRGARRRMAWLLLAVSAAGLLLDGGLLFRARRWNLAMADGSVLHSSGDLPARVRFAQGTLAARAGDQERALGLYKQVEADADPALKVLARYNAGNIHLRNAIVARGGETPAQAIPLLELSKEAYRDVLRQDSSHWPARYNLERALRLAPELDEAEDGGGNAPHAAERAPTTMRGFTLGLP